MIAFVVAAFVTLAVLEIALHCWHDAGGVAGARARDVERRRRRQLAERHPARARRHGR